MQEMMESQKKTGMPFDRRKFCQLLFKKDDATKSVSCYMEWGFADTKHVVELLATMDDLSDEDHKIVEFFARQLSQVGFMPPPLFDEVDALLTKSTKFGKLDLCEVQRLKSLFGELFPDFPHGKRCILFDIDGPRAVGLLPRWRDDIHCGRFQSGFIQSVLNEYINK